MCDSPTFRRAEIGFLPVNGPCIELVVDVSALAALMPGNRPCDSGKMGIDDSWQEILHILVLRILSANEKLRISGKMVIFHNVERRDPTDDLVQRGFDVPGLVARKESPAGGGNATIVVGASFGSLRMKSHRPSDFDEIRQSLELCRERGGGGFARHIGNAIAKYPLCMTIPEIGRRLRVRPVCLIDTERVDGSHHRTGKSTIRNIRHLEVQGYFQILIRRRR